jgi:hypothetical protein
VIVKLHAKKRELQSKIDSPIMNMKKYKMMFAEHHHGKRKLTWRNRVVSETTMWNDI